ncbi:MAG: hypothetical protein ACXWCZ_13910 [Flavisolibacter sp.]
MRRLTLTTLILLAFLTTVSAQETIYFSKDTTTVAKKKKRSSEQNIIKIAPLGFLFGNIPLFYERSINDFLSVQVGAGVTTRNYLREWVSNIGEDDNVESADGKTTWNGTQGDYSNYNSANDFENRKSSLGYLFSIQPRIYFESEGLDGYFIALSYEKARYNFSSRMIETGLAIGEPKYTDQYFKEYDDFSDIAVNTGVQTLYDKISVEYTVGVALRSKKGIRYAYTQDYSGNYIDGYTEIKKNAPAFLIGFKIGYHF